MQIPLQIKFHNLEASPAIEAAVVKYAKKLEKFRDDIVSCRVKKHETLPPGGWVE